MKDAKGHGSNSRGGNRATQEKLAMRAATDERHFPTRSVNDKLAAMTLGQAHPKSGEPVPLGQARQAAATALWKGRNFALAPGQDNRRRGVMFNVDPKKGTTDLQRLTAGRIMFGSGRRK